MPKKSIERKVTDDPRYHDTWRLLKKYRDVVWSLEVSVQQVRSKFQIEYGSSIEDFLEFTKNLCRCDGWQLALDMAVYYTYLSPQKLKNLDEIIDQLHPHIRDISVRTYYRKRNEAVDALGSVLWGYTTQDTLKILDDFFPSQSEKS